MNSSTLAREPARASANARRGLWHNFDNSALPLAMKWSLAIGALICAGMGALGWFLIDQQTESYQQQSEALGQTIVSQLAHAASEPLMADDRLGLQLLLDQLIDNPLILGLEIFDEQRRPVAQKGITPSFPVDGPIRQWHLPQPDGRSQPAISFSQPIRYRDVQAGTARVSLNLAPLRAQLDHTVGLLIAISLLLLLLTVLAAFPLARRFCRPIYQLIEASEALHNGQQSPSQLSVRRDEIGQVMHSFQQLASGAAEKQRLEQALSRHVSSDIAQHLLSDPSSNQLGGRPVTGSVLFCDIVGYTRLVERLQPEATAALLNEYFGYFALAASSCQGTVDKFIGDCIMVVFGVTGRDPQHALHAVTCAWLMQAIAERINDQHALVGAPPLSFRIGINSGEMLAGNLGNAERMEFTVVGDSVNLASRLCALASPGGIVLNQATCDQPGIGDTIGTRAKGKIHIRGRSQPTHAHELTGLPQQYEQQLQQTLNKILIDPDQCQAPA